MFHLGIHEFHTLGRVFSRPGLSLFSVPFLLLLCPNESFFMNLSGQGMGEYFFHALHKINGKPGFDFPFYLFDIFFIFFRYKHCFDPCGPGSQNLFLQPADRKHSAP